MITPAPKPAELAATDYPFCAGKAAKKWFLVARGGKPNKTDKKWEPLRIKNGTGITDNIEFLRPQT